MLFTVYWNWRYEDSQYCRISLRFITILLLLCIIIPNRIKQIVPTTGVLGFQFITTSKNNNKDIIISKISCLLHPCYNYYNHRLYLKPKQSMTNSIIASFSTLSTSTSSIASSELSILTTNFISNRRTAIQTSIVPFGTVIATSMISSLPSLAANLTTTTTTTTTTNMIINQLFDQLHTIPTFCIVSNTTGASYMIYKRDLNMGIGYAFLTYDGAQTVLLDAQQNAIQKGYSNNVWVNATITTIPLDVAIRLALKKRTRSTLGMNINNNNNNKENAATNTKIQALDTLLQIIPGANERLDGMAINKQKFQEQGKVPLFYIIPNENSDSDRTNKIKFYFNRQDLIRDWTKQQQQIKQVSENGMSNNNIPNIGAIDLISIFESLLLNQNLIDNNNNVNTIILNLLLSSSTSSSSTSLYEFIPHMENIVIANELKSKGTLIQYNPNLMIL